MATKPSSKTEWTDVTPGNRAEPTQARKDSGYLVEEPGYRTWNWLIWNLGQWIVYIETVLDNVKTRLRIGSSDEGYIGETGNVGIGKTETTANEKLDVEGNIGFGSDYQGRLTNEGNLYARLEAIKNGSGIKLISKTDGGVSVESLEANKNGNIGIGITPLEKLHLRKEDAECNAIFERDEIPIDNDIISKKTDKSKKTGGASVDYSRIQTKIKDVLNGTAIMEFLTANISSLVNSAMLSPYRLASRNYGVILENQTNGTAGNHDYTMQSNEIGLFIAYQVSPGNVAHHMVLIGYSTDAVNIAHIQVFELKSSPAIAYLTVTSTTTKIIRVNITGNSTGRYVAINIPLINGIRLGEYNI